jgi:hypothetical protein
MSKLNTAYKTYRLLNLLLLDLALVLFFWWLIYDNPRRWPAVAALAPVALLGNFISVRRTLGNRRSLALPIIYGCGLFFGICWTIAQFEWWKLPLLLIPAAFFIKHLRHDSFEFLRRDRSIPR